ncbi:cysteine desulfurase [Verrucosispora sp. WMMA2044]|uniref:cysteine desulfurase n=1 Tax=Verrucosispora sioxanthis TaxID=2499994 RepID=A0A6M1L855_9ACTN|nr:MULTISPECIES: cysteine desulfurase [Micromonospora]NEE65302.1 cysteine desulfurase [Verrucosispora sioxanthis]NGM14412.1 cysteine desulfurase [Verrucosispora sioxanthis]WBB50079.1 cysteine desulfurase [Verrucosispora sp. WMMA2044]
MTTIAIPPGMPQYDDVPRYDVAAVRADFPILDREVNGHPLVYLDSANTSHKPRQVLDVLAEHYARHNANVSRSVHTLGTEATEAYEGARAKVAAFVNAPSVDEVVFTKNSTEAINIVAYAFSNASLRADADPRLRLGPGDEIVISEMEHHSNIVPWQLLAERTGATLRWFPVTDNGRLDESGLTDLVNERTKIVSLVHMSNILGTVNATSRITARVREVEALLLLDCSQSVPHMPIDVVDLDADFIVFTGHKMCAPTGIGVLWGRTELLAAMPPVFGGGSMIETVTMGGSTYAAPPARFEAGTPPIAEAVALGAAVDYLTGIGMRSIQWHEKQLTAYALDALGGVPGLRIFGPEVPVGRGGTISFALGDVHPHDVGQVLDSLGVQVRVGHHCARPVCTRFGVPATTRASFYLYTTTEEIDALVAGLEQVRKVFA